MLSVDAFGQLLDLLDRVDLAWGDGDEDLYEDLQEQVRCLCDRHPELTPVANDAGIFGGGPEL